MKSKMLLCFLSLFMAAAGASANERIYVNREVTTHIVMPENIKMVDISTTKIAGNQCTDNIVRIKPSCGSDSIPEAGYRDNELLGTLTLIGERHIAQYDILYTQSPQMAASIFEVPYSHTQSYINPEVTMPMAEMARYAWAVYGSGRKYNQIVSRAHGMKAVVNNIYAVGDYFFIDYSQGDQLADHRAVSRILPEPCQKVQEELPQRAGATQADVPGREGLAAGDF